ncbi:MAG: protein phosphatase CheZ [Pseudomonadota bacterium]
MSMLEVTGNNPESMPLLLEQAKILLAHLEAGDSISANQIIEKMREDRETSLYKEVGRLTRTVHDALVQFGFDTAQMIANSAHPELKSEEVVIESSRMSDAENRLQYVITMTENAANKTMDMVEETVPLSKELSNKAQMLKGEWEKLIRREMTGAEFRQLYKLIDDFLKYSIEKSGEIDSNLSNILLAQDFQDLTGQIIRKVISLVKEVEVSLVNLVRASSAIEKITGIEKSIETNVLVESKNPHAGFGPSLPGDKRDVVSGQDDVDDLLSSLGF